MEITKENKDQLNATLTLTINEQDYKSKVDEALKSYSRKAQIKGFRQGKAPLGMIKKMVGSSILMQEIDKIVSETLSKYIADEKLDLLGQPLPSEKQMPIEPENQKEFQFFFDIAVAPEFELVLNKKTKVPYYNISVDDDIIEKEIERYKNQFGKTEKSDKITEKSYLKCDIEQLDADGNIAVDGITVKDKMIAVDLIKDEEQKKKILDKKENDSFEFDIKKAYPNDTEIAGILDIEKEKILEINTSFQITIKEITSFYPSELNQDLFNKVFGEDTVKTEDEFIEKIKSNINDVYVQESEYRFSIDVREKIVNKLKLSLPDEFLKRWLKATNENEKLDNDTIEKEYPFFSKDLEWQIIKNKISKEQNFEISIEEVREESRKFTEAQFAQYGLPLGSLSEEQMQSFIDKNLEREQDRTKFAEKVIENKVIEFLKEAIKLEDTIINLEDFKKLYEKAN